MAVERAACQSWEQMWGESGPAYAAFRAYRDMGPDRSFAGAARQIGRNESLLRRWAARHRWRERAWQWDLQQARQEETVVREHREAVLRDRLEDLDRLGRACLVFFRTLIRRDPGSGEVSFDPRFTPQVALRFLELTLKAQGVFAPSTSEQETEPPASAADLFGLADAELVELIALAKERAG
jgi:transposase-like protein